MPFLLVRHKVKDYAAWKPFFDRHATARKAGGCKGGYLYRNIDNPNETVVIFEWDKLDRARAFAGSEDLRKIMEQAGVADKPDIYFLEQIEKFKA